MIYESAKHPSKSIEYSIDNKGCWIVVSHVPNSSGYVCIKRDEVYEPLHRYVYKKEKGDIPKGHVIRHTCDNKLCINPEHLITGTHEQNTQDAVNRNRTTQGTKNSHNKLTEEQVLFIRNSKLRTSTLADMFGVSDSTVSRIKSRELWRHLKGGQ